MRQLDLFGGFIDVPEPTDNSKGRNVLPAAPSKKEEPEEKLEDSFVIEQYSVLAKEPTEIPEYLPPTSTINPSPKHTSGIQKEGVVFSDGKISVRIKAKPKPPIEIPAKEKELRIKSSKELQKRGRKSLKEVDSTFDLIEIPEDEILYKKQYYPIREVAEWFHVNPSLLRFWENEFDILKPRKNGKGDRLFRPEDVKNLQLIYLLLRQKKYSVEGAKEYLKANKKDADKQLLLMQTLQKFKSFLLDIKVNLSSE